MADHPNILLQDIVKYRDGKKWKTRWCVLEKSSPVADQVIISLYHDFTTFRDVNSRETLSLSLGDFCGMECSLSIQRHPNVLSIITLQRIILLAFDRRDRMIEWETKIRSALGKVADHKFTISIPNRGKLPPGPATMYFCHNHMAITTSVPVKLLGAWQLQDISRFGNIEEGFAFEANKSSTSGSGIFVLLTDQGQFIKDILDSMVRNDFLPVDTIRQSFESDTNMENKPLLTYTNECAITLETPPEDKFEKQELTKRDIALCERKSIAKSGDVSPKQQTFDNHDVYLDHKSRNDCGFAREVLPNASWSTHTAEEYEMKQPRRHCTLSKTSSYSSPKERFSGGHLEDYGVVSEIQKADDYALANRMQNLNISDVANSSNASTQATVFSKDLDPWNSGNTRWTSYLGQKILTSEDVLFQNLKNCGKIITPGMNISPEMADINTPGSMAIREEEYELMAPFVPKEQQQRRSNTKQSMDTMDGKNYVLPMSCDIEYELMSPQKYPKSTTKITNNGNIQEDVWHAKRHHHQQHNVRDTKLVDDGPQHEIVYSAERSDLIRETEYELMAPLVAPSELHPEPARSPVRLAEYEIMLPQSKRGNALTTKHGSRSTAGTSNMYRNVPTTSRIMHTRAVESREGEVALEKERTQPNIETVKTAGPMRDTEYEIMVPRKSSLKPHQLKLDLKSELSNYDVPSNMTKYADHQNVNINIKDHSVNGRNSDIFTVVKFPENSSVKHQSRPLSPIMVDPSVPKPLPVTFKLLTPPSSPTFDEPIPKPLPVTCKLQGVEVNEEDATIPVPFEHSQLVSPNTKREELSMAATTDGNHGGSAILARGDSKSSRKSFLSHKRKRCTTDPSRAVSPNIVENSLSSEADIVESKECNKGKTCDEKGYQRKRSLTDPDSVKCRDKVKGKGSLRKSKKKGNCEKSDKTENIQLSSLYIRDKESSSASDESSSKAAGFKALKKVKRSSLAKDKVPLGSLRLPRKYSLSETSETYSMVSLQSPKIPCQLARFEKRSQSFDWPGNEFGRQRYQAAVFQRPRTASEYDVVFRNGSNSNHTEKQDISTELRGAVGGISEMINKNDNLLKLSTLPTLAERRSQSSAGSAETLEHVLASISSPNQQNNPDRKSQASSTGDVIEEVMLGADSLVEQCSMDSNQARRRKISHSRTLSMPDCSTNPWTIHETAILLQNPSASEVGEDTKTKAIEMNSLGDDSALKYLDCAVEYAEIDFHATQKMAKS
ncbi:uncharacterized protein [Ptychodera flava]|uniref:uncharacterized protein n=1 Tax=Ptychodera flava TaxID=63121 RepID=UPI00396A6DFC